MCHWLIPLLDTVIQKSKAVGHLPLVSRIRRVTNSDVCKGHAVNLSGWCRLESEGLVERSSLRKKRGESRYWSFIQNCRTSVERASDFFKRSWEFRFFGGGHVVYRLVKIDLHVFVALRALAVASILLAREAVFVSGLSMDRKGSVV